LFNDIAVNLIVPGIVNAYLEIYVVLLLVSDGGNDPKVSTECNDVNNIRDECFLVR
jgi:hypothetical protein